MPFVDYYRILGVSKHATQDEIKAAFRRLSKQYHPDLHDNSSYYADKFIEIKGAYEVLGDETTRRIYQHFYDAHYNPPVYPKYDQGNYGQAPPTQQSGKVDARPFLVVMAMLVIFFAAFVFSSSPSEIPVAKVTTFAYRNAKDGETEFAENHGEMSPPMLSFMTSTFRITIHEYRNKGIANTAFNQLTNLKFGVGLTNYGDSIFRIDMPFTRPLSDTAFVKDSVSKIFDTECKISL